MKKVILGALMISAISFTACDKNDDIQKKNDKSELSDFTRRYLNLSQDIQQVKSRDIKNNNKINSSISRSLKSTRTKSGDNDENTNNWTDTISCATISEGTNTDGFNYIIYDYGETGCEEWGALTKGKMTWLWKETEKDNVSTYTYEDIYEDYISDDYYQDGYYKWNGTYNSNNDNFEGTTNSKMTYKWEKETTMSESSYKDKYTEDLYTILEGKESWTEKDKSYSYVMTIVKPLVYDYTCKDSYVPVSGVEKVDAKEDGKETSITIDYGEGKCDNLVKITENGVTIEVDLSDDWKEESDDDNNQESTGTSN